MSFPSPSAGEGLSGYESNAQNAPKIATYGTGIRQSTSASNEGFRAHFDMLTSFERGDSGGGFTYGTDDETGPVLGLAVSLPRVTPGQANGLLFWEPTNIEWIWSVLDASGVCGLGSGPCVLREPIPAGGSVCGDGHCTGTETYSACPAECSPALPDADGDGLPDMRDLCPYLDARTLSADRIVDGNHIDLDQNRLGDDCTPVDCDVTCGPDPDRDGVPSPCDICPDAWDPEQLDTDGDGIGDGCDNCPFVPNADQMNSDEDPRGNACDNCPGLTNPLQMNCNAEAEAAFPDPEQPQGYGDICDPVPCGDTLLEARVTNEIIGGRPGRAIRMDQLQVDALASEALTATAGFRFCRCPGADADDIETRALCALDAGTLDACVISDINAYDFTNEDQPWRQSAVDYRDAPTIRLDDDLDGLRREAVLQYTPLTRMLVIPPGGVPEDGTLEAVFTPELYATWNHEHDTARWSTIAAAEQAEVNAGLLDPLDRRFPNEESDFPGDIALPGVLWTHTAREAFSVPGSPESYEAGPDLPRAERRRASHYWSGAVAPTTTAISPFPCLNYVGPLLESGACSLCGAVFPAPFVATGGTMIGGGCGGGGGTPQPPLLALPELPLDLSPVLGFDPGVLFSQGNLLWLTPSEPIEWLGAETALAQTALANGSRATRLRMVALNPTTFEPQHVLAHTDQGLVLLGEQVQTPPVCDNPNGCIQPNAPTSFAAQAGQAQVSSDPAEQPVFVLSARHERLWRFEQGGVVIVQTLTPPFVREVATVIDEIRGEVLAATYRANDDALYVLSEVVRNRRVRHRHGHWRHSKLRLVRIPLGPRATLSGEATVLREWPRLGNNSRFTLVADPSGALWVGASAFGGHVVFRLEPRAQRWRPGRVRWRATGWAHGTGELSDLSGTADRRGLSMVVEDAGIERVVGYRTAELQRVRWRDLARCF